jgi:hypothetical protein
MPVPGGEERGCCYGCEGGRGNAAPIEASRQSKPVEGTSTIVGSAIDEGALLGAT